MKPALLFVEPGFPVPPVDRPFCVLLDADDAEWTGDEHLRRLAVALLEAGCRYFVCFGVHSEEVHDRIDDCIVEKALLGEQADYEGVTTTYHTDESVADVAEFFLNCALPDMRGALVIARDGQKWSAALSRAVIGG